MMIEITVLQHMAKDFSYKGGNEASLSKVYPVGHCSLTQHEILPHSILGNDDNPSTKHSYINFKDISARIL